MKKNQAVQSYKRDFKLYVRESGPERPESSWICPKCGHKNDNSWATCRGQGCNQTKN